ncbi:MAG: hypothetical protein OXH77_05345 [Anaerolineaceae bacterium]|nr:hypothetical protein [Anaerolineaceae bacterium]
MKARRVLRAFVVALVRTLRNEPVSADAIERWRVSASEQLTAIEALTAREGVAPEALRLRIDRREMSMGLILAGLRYHLDEEFPHLRRRFGDESLGVLRANCLDDSFRLGKLADALPCTPALQTGLQTLAQHLLEVPEPEPR